jgi:hypothetical protein
LTYSWKQCAGSPTILSGATRRTEVRRGTLKRATRGTRSQSHQKPEQGRRG